MYDKKIMVSLIGLLFIAAVIVLAVLFADKGEATEDTLAVSSTGASSEPVSSAVSVISSELPVSSEPVSSDQPASSVVVSEVSSEIVDTVSSKPVTSTPTPVEDTSNSSSSTSGIEYSVETSPVFTD